MTYRNYRTQLHKQMLNYLRFMKHADTDEQLLELHAEVTELKAQIHYLDQLTVAQLLQTIAFKVDIYESDGFSTTEIKTVSAKRHFERSVSVKNSRSKIEPRETKYTGVCFSPSIGRYVATLSYDGKKYLTAHCVSEEEAIKQRDRCIIKHKLPVVLQFLKPKQ
jgi:hypothetical protein